MMKRRRATTYDQYAGQPSLFDTPASDTAGEETNATPEVRITFTGGTRRGLAPGSVDAPDPVSPSPRTKPLRFISFGSGSSGNCSYVGTGSSGVLIDAGVDIHHVERTLLTNAITMDSVAGICLTHDHSDHVCSAYRLLSTYRHMRLYCTPKTLTGLLRRHSISRRIKDYHVAVYKEFPFRIGDIELTAFDVSHDGTDNCGYHVSGGGTTFTIATDLGCITERVDHYMRLAEHIVIEANYDAEMLRSGHYPLYLQSRIKAERGHLDNEETGRYLASIMSERLRSVYLCHLSHDNNTPELALGAVRRALEAAGSGPVGDGSCSLEAERCRVQLAALPRYDASPLYTFTRRR